MEINNFSIGIKSGNGLLNIKTPVVMGILNTTPDSFYSQSRVTTKDAILKRAEEIISQGGSIIDIGAFSTRPGAENITIDEEISRLDLALSVIRKSFPESILSVDTFRSKVAAFAVENYNADIINDISGGDLDDNMFETIAKSGVTYILMHMQGTPQTMQLNPQYKQVTSDIILSLSEKTDRLAYMGVKDVIIDPGFGFGKTIDHNFELISQLHHFKIFKKPILAGISRKSFIYKTLNTTPEKALNGTTVLNTIALIKGADILRVHDVKEAMDCIKLVGKLQAE